jgi:hypothetical protein
MPLLLAEQVEHVPRHHLYKQLLVPDLLSWAQISNLRLTKKSQLLIGEYRLYVRSTEMSFFSSEGYLETPIYITVIVNDVEQ